MHPLNLTGERRERYTATGALAIDVSGREVLLGLTPEESGFVLEGTMKPAESLTVLHRQRLAVLVTRHERARLRSMAATPGTSTKDEARQG